MLVTGIDRNRSCGKGPLLVDCCHLPTVASGRSLSVVTMACAGQVECKQLVSTDAIDWSVAMQMGGQAHAITQLGDAEAMSVSA